MIVSRPTKTSKPSKLYTTKQIFPIFIGLAPTFSPKGQILNAQLTKGVAEEAQPFISL